MIPGYDITLTSDLVEKTVEILEKKGWTRGVYRDALTGSRCIMGAFADATEVGSIALLEQSPVADELGKLIGAPTRRVVNPGPEGVHMLEDRHEIAMWNDAPTRTEAEVLEKLTDVAKRLRDEGR